MKTWVKLIYATDGGHNKWSSFGWWKFIWIVQTSYIYLQFLEKELFDYKSYFIFSLNRLGHKYKDRTFKKHEEIVSILSF